MDAITIGSDESHKTTMFSSLNGMQSATNDFNRTMYAGFFCYGNEKKADLREQFCEASAKAFSELSSACVRASQLMTSVAQLYEDNNGPSFTLSHIEAISRREYNIVFALWGGEDIRKIEVRYDASRNRWFIGNDRLSGTIADVVEATGMQRAYLEGVADGIKSVTSECVDVKVDESVNQMLVNLFVGAERFNRNPSLRDLFGRLIRKELSFSELKELVNSLPAVADVDHRRAMVRLQRSVRMMCHENKMPEPPPAKGRVKDMVPPDKPGIYFCWRNSVCVYVGKSVNIQSRLRSHNIVGPHDDVSWLEFDEHEIHHAELFYIWLLRPSENSESKSSENAQRKSRKVRGES